MSGFKCYIYIFLTIKVIYTETTEKCKESQCPQITTAYSLVKFLLYWITLPCLFVNRYFFCEMSVSILNFECSLNY